MLEWKTGLEGEEEGPGVFGKVTFDRNRCAVFRFVPLKVEAPQKEIKIQ